MPTSTVLGYNPSPLFDIGTGFDSVVRWVFIGQQQNQRSHL